MSSKTRGFTLVEMIIAIVIIGVGLAGVLSAFTMTVRASADPLIRKQMLSIAEEMLEEVLLKPYASRSGTITGCNRTNADDVSDYNNYSQPVCSPDGTVIGNLSTYTVSVSVDSAATLGTLGAGVKKIKVTVQRGSDALTLVGWRTDYAS